MILPIFSPGEQTCGETKYLSYSGKLHGQIEWSNKCTHHCWISLQNSCYVDQLTQPHFQILSDTSNFFNNFEILLPTIEMGHISKLIPL